MTSSQAKLFGVPVGDFGLLSSFLLAVASACFTFFLFTFLSIVAIAVYNLFGHSLNYADSYKYISFPAGCLALAISLIFFGTLWLRRKLSRSS